MKEKVLAFIQANRKNYGLIFGILLTICVLLPWYNTDVPNRSDLQYNQTNYVTHHWVFGIKGNWGKVIFIIAVAAVYLIYTKQKYTVFIGVVLCILGIYKLFNYPLVWSKDLLIQPSRAYSAAFGLYFFIISSVCFTLVTLKLFTEKNKSQP